MNRPAQPDPHSPIDAEASAAPTKPKTAKGSRFWSLLVGLLLAAALVLFTLDRLGVRLPATPAVQTSMPTGPAGLSEAGSGSPPASAPTISSPATVSAANPAVVAPTPAKPVVVFARQQDQIQALIGQVQGLPSLAQAPTVAPSAQAPTAQAPQASQAGIPPVNSLPQTSQESVAAPPASQSASATSVQDPLAGPSIWSRLSDSLSELFVVRRLSPAAQPMLDPTGDRLARQELRLLLLSARMSLMMEQPRQARADLVAAQGLLPKFFRTEDSAVQAFAEQLTAVLTSLPGQS